MDMFLYAVEISLLYGNKCLVHIFVDIVPQFSGCCILLIALNCAAGGSQLTILHKMYSSIVLSF